MLKSKCSEVASKTVVVVSESWILTSSWCGNVTRGGERALRRVRSLHGGVDKGFSLRREAKLSRNVLKLSPSNVVWFVEIPIANPPHLNDVTCPYF